MEYTVVSAFYQLLSFAALDLQVCFQFDLEIDHFYRAVSFSFPSLPLPISFISSFLLGPNTFAVTPVHIRLECSYLFLETYFHVK